MLHHEAPLGDIHKLYNWEVADTTARDNLSVVAADIGKVCKITNPLSLYILTAVSPASWLAIQVGQLEAHYNIKNETANYTALLADANTTVVMLNSVADVTLTILDNATTPFPVGTTLTYIQQGTGQVIFAAASPAAIISPETLKTRKPGSAATLLQVAADLWYLMGDLETT